MQLAALASPIKAGSSPSDNVIDTYIKEYRPDAELLAVLDSTAQDPLVKVLAIRAVAADRQQPKHRRLGMERIAWFYHVSERTLCAWWDAYQKGGVGALQRPAENLGRVPKVGRAAPGEARGRPLARNARAKAGKGIGKAKKSGDAKGAAAPPRKLTVKEFGDEIERTTGVRYSKSHLYALLASLAPRQGPPRKAAPAARRGGRASTS